MHMFPEFSSRPDQVVGCVKTSLDVTDFTSSVVGSISNMRDITMELPSMTAKNRGTTITDFVIGLAGPILIPIIHFAFEAHIWRPHRAEQLADPSTCSCSCWDTLFKGPYENSPQPGYKHVYFNLNRTTALLWTITVISFTAFYELLKYLVKLYKGGHVRYKMLLLLSFSIYPHYYSWWGYFNAFNDTFYDQLVHQFIFSSTELASTVAIAILCDKRIENEDKLSLTIYFVATFHILCAGADQFLSNVIFGQGETHQQTRDVMFMLSDIMNLVVSLRVIYNLSIIDDSLKKPLRKRIACLFLLAIVCTLIVKRL